MRQSNRHRRCLLSLSVRLFLLFLVLFPHRPVNAVVLAWFLFYRIISWFQLYVHFRIFFVRLFSNKYGNFVKLFSFSDWLLLANCLCPIVSLHFLIQSNPSNGVLSLLSSVISMSIFCFLFSFSMCTGIFL